MKLAIATLSTVSLVSFAAPAMADQHRYAGMHPLGDDAKDGFCYLEVAHVHASLPVPKIRATFETRGPENDFVGDPVPFGYDGPRYGYYGHHPVVADFEIAGDSPFCYIDGPHYHEVAASGPAFEHKGDLYWYTGTLPAYYVRDPRHHQRVNVIYKPIVYARPAVAVEPPPAYLAVHVHGGHADLHAGTVVPTPVPVAVDLHIGSAPPPPVVVEKRTVVVVDDHHHHPGKHKGHHKPKKWKKHGR